MDALFIELPAFQRHREAYLPEAAFTALQVELLRNPFTVYRKDDQADLSMAQRQSLKQRLGHELAARAKHET